MYWASTNLPFLSDFAKLGLGIGGSGVVQEPIPLFVKNDFSGEMCLCSVLHPLMKDHVIGFILTLASLHVWQLNGGTNSLNSGLGGTGHDVQVMLRYYHIYNS